jgi:hypothetical protein
MKSKSIARTVLSFVAIGALFGSAQLMAEGCLSVKGKILNSLHDPALGSVYAGEAIGNIGGVSTVGVAALNGENPIGKMKCALVGVATGLSEVPEGSLFPALPSFTHTISCDDSVDDAFFGVVHSQLTFDTTGYITGFDGCTASFTENSIPQSESGKGVFDGATSGVLTIDGTSNVCNGSIDMEFTGEVCYD